MDYRLMQAGEDTDYRLMQAGEDKDYRLMQAGEDTDYRLMEAGEDTDYRLMQAGEDTDYRLMWAGEDTDYRLMHAGEDTDYHLMQAGEDTDYRILQARESTDYKILNYNSVECFQNSVCHIFIPSVIIAAYFPPLLSILFSLFSSLFLYPWPNFSSIYKICCFLNFFQLSSCPPQIVFAELYVFAELHVFANTCNLFPHIRTHSVCTFSVEILSRTQM
jgi:hypothetical protein